MTANLTLNQVGLPAGTANEAREDGLLTGAVVTATASGYVSTFRMELLWIALHGVPDTTAEASFAPSGLSSYVFTPTVGSVGTYLVRLVTDEGTPDADEITLAFSAKTSPTALRIPAPQERGDPNASLINATPAQKRLSWFNKPELSGPFAGAGGTWAPWWRPHADMIHIFNTSGGAPVPSSRAINTTAPLQGGGDFSIDRTHTIDAATTIARGTMSDTDKLKLDGIAANAAALTASAPVNVTKAAAAVGVATDAARADHKHDITTATATTIGTANSEGVAASLARSDHGHDHGAQTLGTHHAAATTSVNGFMSAADKLKLDAIQNALVYVEVAGTIKTLALSDAYTVQETTNASPVTITIPPNVDVAFEEGTVIGYNVIGAGQLTLAPGAAVTLQSSGSELKSARQFAKLHTEKRDTNIHLVTGEKAA